MPPQPQPMSRTLAPGLDEELGGDQPLLGELRLVEGHVGPLEVGAGILHVAVEEEPVETFVEVVVMGDVGARRLQPDRMGDRRVGDAAAEVLEPRAGGEDLGAGVGLGEGDES